MENKLIVLSVIVLCALFQTSCNSDDPVTPESEPLLIAQYPLLSDGIDDTGLNDRMTLTNVPFENGGIYCNGLYVHGDPDYCLAQSPPINNFNFNSFSISMDFFVTEEITQPVWIIGTSCRWLGFYLNDDGTVSLLYNNWDFWSSSKTYSLYQWHNAQITFDGTTVEFFLDNEIAGSLKFGGGYVPLNYNGSECGTSDTEIGVTNYSNGQVLQGHIRNLTVHSPN